MAYNSKADRSILSVISGDWSTLEIWAYDANSDTWTLLADGPVGMFGQRIVYDAESDRIIMFGGLILPAFAWYVETWAYDYNTDTWTNMHPRVHPSVRNFQGMVYDSKADRVVMWGDWKYLLPSHKADRSVWTYDYNTIPGRSLSIVRMVRQAVIIRGWPMMKRTTRSSCTVDTNDGRVKALYIMGENPILSAPNTNHVKEALCGIEFLVTHGIFLNETAQMAHVVLPGVSFAEKEGTFTNTERRCNACDLCFRSVAERGVILRSSVTSGNVCAVRTRMRMSQQMSFIPFRIGTTLVPLPCGMRSPL